VIEINKGHLWSSSINGFQISPYFQELQTFAGQGDNYTASVIQIEKYLRISVNSSQMERVTKCYGAQLEDQMKEVAEVQLFQVKELKEVLGDDGRAYCMVDGSMIPTREGEDSNDWKEIKLGRIFGDVDNYELDKNHNWISHSIYLAHLGAHRGFVNKFEPIVDVLDDLSERLVFVADGAPWIWNWIEECYGKATQVLDFYHAMEHLAAFGKVYFTKKEEQKKWLSIQKNMLLNDQVVDIIQEITQLSKRTAKVDKTRKSLLTYLQNNQHRMLYKTYMDNDISIGSGAIESAHRTVVQKRLKQSGQRWTLDGAQKIVDLRVVQASQQWHRVIDLIKENEYQNYRIAA